MQKDNFKEAAKRRRKSIKSKIMDKGRQRLRRFMTGGMSNASLCVDTFGMFPGEFERFLRGEIKKLDPEFKFRGFNRLWKVEFIQHPKAFMDGENPMLGFHFNNLKIVKIVKKSPAEQ